MSNIKIISQHIKDLSFEVPNAPEVFLNPQDKPDILLTINIDAKKLAEETYEVSLKITANATASEKKLFIWIIVHITKRVSFNKWFGKS